MSPPRERPILFSGPMVRAILDGRKTQTRRLVKPLRRWEHYDQVKVGMPYAADPWNVWWHGPETDRVGCMQACPYGVPGARLWGRETHSVVMDGAYHDGVNTQSSFTVTYKAGGEREIEYDGPMGGDDAYLRAFDSQRGEWRPSIYMPRWASRLTLEITGVRVQRLQEISEEDARAEGCDGSGPVGYIPAKMASPCVYDYARLWDSINAKRAPWSSNPWVWALTFRRIS